MGSGGGGSWGGQRVVCGFFPRCCPPVGDEGGVLTEAAGAGWGSFNMAARRSGGGPRSRERVRGAAAVRWLLAGREGRGRGGGGKWRSRAAGPAGQPALRRGGRAERPPRVGGCLAASARAEGRARARSAEVTRVSERGGGRPASRRGLRRLPPSLRRGTLPPTQCSSVESKRSEEKGKRGCNREKLVIPKCPLGYYHVHLYSGHVDGKLLGW